MTFNRFRIPPSAKQAIEQGISSSDTKKSDAADSDALSKKALLALEEKLLEWSNKRHLENSLGTPSVISMRSVFADEADEYVTDNLLDFKNDENSVRYQLSADMQNPLAAFGDFRLQIPTQNYSE